MGIGAKPRHDIEPYRHTAFDEGREAYIANRPLDYLRHQDEQRQEAYEAGWLQESMDHMDAVPAPKLYGRKR